MNKEKLIKDLEKILKYKLDGEDPVIVLGPDRTKRSKLRIYAYGGRLGRIRTESGNSELLDKKYEQYLADPEEAKELNEMLTSGDKESMISSKEYLELAVKATKAKFKKENQTYGERRIQTQIVKECMKRENGWCAIDMDVCL